MCMFHRSVCNCMFPVLLLVMLCVSDHTIGFLGCERAVRVVKACQHIQSPSIIRDSRDPLICPDLSILFISSLSCVLSCGVEFGARATFADARQAAEALPHARSITEQRTHSPPRWNSFTHLTYPLNYSGDRGMSI